MEQNPSWEASSSSSSQETSCILWNLRCYYVHKSLPLFPILSQINSICALPCSFCKLHVSIILPSLSRSLVCFVQVSLPKSCVHFSSPHIWYMHYPSHSPSCDHLNSIWWGVQFMELSLCSFLQSPLTFFLLGLNIKLRTLFSYTISL